ncbi:MAG: hypothetical protein Q4E88_05790 [Coriobacteriia bacterium]|nr:hypothetical protein [Coriobacteriia bacterium]
MLNPQDMHKLARLNPFKSVDKVIDYGDKLMGVKNTSKMPMDYINNLGYTIHTLDATSLGGRAVDFNLKNPITGNYMTGSSSGTAINVFANINHIGAGLDGGSSVLAPAVSLNLFAFVSKLLAQDELAIHKKTSTDGIEFSPSLGFMTKSFDELMNVVPFDVKSSEVNFIQADVDINAPRKVLIQYLLDTLPKYDFILSKEGPIDLYGIGDSVLGHFENTHEIQNRSNKGLIKVVNMAGATAICIPTKKHAVSNVLICESDPDKISVMLGYAKTLIVEPDELTQRYFSNIDMYTDSLEDKL